MNIEKDKLTSEELELVSGELLRLMGDSFVHIRLISELNSDGISDKEILKLIYDIADASHNLPSALTEINQNSSISFLENDIPRLRDLLDRVREIVHLRNYSSVAGHSIATNNVVEKKSNNIYVWKGMFLGFIFGLFLITFPNILNMIHSIFS